MNIALAIKDFQILENVRFDFKPGLNVITGPSGSGKTAVLRALRCLVLNPKGSQRYIREGQSQAVVAIKFGDAPAVTWYRTKTSTSYKVGSEVFIKAGKTKADRLTPDFPLVIEESTNRVLSLTGEWDHLFPFDKSPSEMFTLFEDLFQVESAEVILDLMKADEVAKKDRVAELDRKILIYNGRVAAIDSCIANVDVKVLEDFLKKVVDAQDLSSMTWTDCEIAKKLSLTISASVGLKPGAFDLGLVAAKEQLQAEYVLAFSLSSWLSTPTLPPGKFDFTSVEQLSSLEHDLSETMKSVKFLESTTGLVFYNLVVAVQEQYDALYLSYQEAVNAANVISVLEEEDKMIKETRASISKEMEAFSTCPVCGQQLATQHGH